MWSVTIECPFLVIDLDNGIDGSTILLLKDDIDEFMAVVPKSGHRLIIKKIIREEQTRTVSVQNSVERLRSKGS